VADGCGASEGTIAFKRAGRHRCALASYVERIQSQHPICLAGEVEQKHPYARAVGHLSNVGRVYAVYRGDGCVRAGDGHCFRQSLPNLIGTWRTDDTNIGIGTSHHYERNEGEVRINSSKVVYVIETVSVSRAHKRPMPPLARRLS
jgi:hypothetical protein